MIEFDLAGDAWVCALISKQKRYGVISEDLEGYGVHNHRSM